jgi:hypothetical protein
MPRRSHLVKAGSGCYWAFRSYVSARHQTSLQTLGVKPEATSRQAMNQTSEAKLKVSPRHGIGVRLCI